MTKLCDTCEYLRYCARSGIEEVGCDRYQKDTTTNEEWLRQASTEQLADLMSRIVGCSNCPIPKDGRSCMGTYSGCWQEIIKWLKQPHTSKE